MTTDRTVDPALASWVESAQGSDFPIQNLPLGIFSEAKGARRPGIAIGDYVLDLSAIADLLDDDWREDLSQPVLNAWLARGHLSQRLLRSRLIELLSDERYRGDVETALRDLATRKPPNAIDQATIDALAQRVAKVESALRAPASGPGGGDDPA